jgi:hypothetical protein
MVMMKAMLMQNASLALRINYMFLGFAGAENSSRIFTAPAVSKNSVLDTILFADRIKTCQEILRFSCSTVCRT